jgi:hypothetical protein
MVAIARSEERGDWAVLDSIDIVASRGHRASQQRRQRRLCEANRRDGKSGAGMQPAEIKRLIFMSSIGAQTGSTADHVVTGR